MDNHVPKFDSETTNFKDLVDEFVDQYSCTFGDVVKLFYFCANSESNIRIHSDQDLMNMFAKYMSSKCCCMSIVYHKPNVVPPKKIPYGTMFKSHAPRQCQPLAM